MCPPSRLDNQSHDTFAQSMITLHNSQSDCFKHIFFHQVDCVQYQYHHKLTNFRLKIKIIITIKQSKYARKSIQYCLKTFINKCRDDLSPSSSLFTRLMYSCELQGFSFKAFPMHCATQPTTAPVLADAPPRPKYKCTHCVVPSVKGGTTGAPPAVV